MPFKGEEAVEFLVETDYVLTGATVTNLVIRKPSGTVVTWDADIYEETILRYISVTNDLDEDGEYEGHPQVTLGTKVRKGPWFTFKVGEVLA